MYIDSVNVGPTCTALDGWIEYCVSHALRNVLACSNRDGETVDGRVVDSLAPDVVIARFINGTASSIFSSTLRISDMINLISISFWARALDDKAPLWASSSADAAFSSRRASDCMSCLIVFVRETADSSDVFPLAAINSIMSIAGEMT